MSITIFGEIEKYLSKKTVYFKKFSIELQRYLELSYPRLPTTKARWYMLKHKLTEIPRCRYPTCDDKCDWNESRGIFSAGCCVDHKKRITSLRNYGTEHPNQSKKQQKKVKNSMNVKYGVDYITQTKSHRDSVKDTVKARYGVDSILQATEIREKISKTNIKRYGVKYPMSNSLIKAKSKETNLKRLGVEETLSSPKIRAKINKTNMERYGTIFPMRNREMLERRQRHIIDKYDSYSPLIRRENKQQNYLLDKTIAAENQGTTYFSFFDDEIENKQPQIQWITTPIITHVITDVIFRVINYNSRDDFIMNNSLYNKDSEMRQSYGVYSNEELVGIFSGCDRGTHYEITRYVTRIGYGFSFNLMGSFISHINKSSSIVIMMDRRFTPLHQPMLYDVGFEFVGGTEPKQLKYGWDCGKLVYKKIYF